MKKPARIHTQYIFEMYEDITQSFYFLGDEILLSTGVALESEYDGYPFIYHKHLNMQTILTKVKK